MRNNRTLEDDCLDVTGLFDQPFKHLIHVDGREYCGYNATYSTTGCPHRSPFMDEKRLYPCLFSCNVDDYIHRVKYDLKIRRKTQ